MNRLIAANFMDYGYTRNEAEMLVAISDMLIRLVATFERGVGRMPTQTEADILYLIARRECGVPEHLIEPEHRRH